MICNFLKFLDLTNMRANDCLFLFVYSDCTEDLSIHELFVVEILQGCWDLPLIFLVEDNLAS